MFNMVDNIAAVVRVRVQLPSTFAAAYRRARGHSIGLEKAIAISARLFDFGRSRKVSSQKGQMLGRVLLAPWSCRDQRSATFCRHSFEMMPSPFAGRTRYVDL